MSDEAKRIAITETSKEEAALRERREFLKRTGKIAVTAPAVALLLSVAAKNASAQSAAPISGNTEIINP
jgi:hypothetical protein